MAKKKKELTVPTIEELEQELQRERYKKDIAGRCAVR